MTSSSQKPHVSRCGVTRKVGFKTHEQALLRGGEILSAPNAKAREFRAYFCLYCGLYHLTSKTAYRSYATQTIFLATEPYGKQLGPENLL